MTYTRILQPMALGFWRRLPSPATPEKSLIQPAAIGLRASTTGPASQPHYPLVGRIGNRHGIPHE